MVDTETMSGEIVVFNRGIRIYGTSRGKLNPQMSISLPEKEARALLDYTDIVNFEKVSPHASARMKELEKENEALKAKVQETETPKSKPKETTTAKRKK